MRAYLLPSYTLHIYSRNLFHPRPSGQLASATELNPGGDLLWAPGSGGEQIMRAYVECVFIYTPGAFIPTLFWTARRIQSTCGW